MIGWRRNAGGSATFIENARMRGFAGLALDGVDVPAAIAATSDARLLTQAIDTAIARRETIWAERLARRLCECDTGTSAQLTLASLLASSGHLDEAHAALAKIPLRDRERDERYRRIAAILCAKEGRIDEALALFATLPRPPRSALPLATMLSVVHEMIGQCELRHATALLEKLHETYPDHLLVRSLILLSHLYAGDLDAARALARLPDSQREAASAHDRRSFVAAVAEIYELTGWTQELFDYLRDEITRDPTHWALYGIAANAATDTARDTEYAALVAAIPAASLTSAEAMAVLCRWHADESRFADGEKLLEEIRLLSASLFLNADLYLKIRRGDQGEIDAAFAAVRHCGIAVLGPALAHSLHAYYYNCSVDGLRQSLTNLKPFMTAERTRAVFWQTYLRCLIGLGEEDQAADHFATLPRGLTGGAMLKPFGIYFDQRRGRHAQARADWTHYVRATRHAAVNARSSYPRTVQLKYAETPGAVLLFLTVFNGSDYLPWFLEHYRKMGVDHFFITDNASSDNTAALLHAQPDVSLFSNPDSFAKSGFGVIWTNHLMQRFGTGHWCFHVDADEGFVFPGYEAGRTLRDLLAYCDDRDFGMVRALALDMYPENLDTVGATDPFAASCYFDIDYFAVPSELPPYVMIQGGLRRRLTGLASSLQKSSLVKMAPDVRYLNCSHGTTHLPVADVTAALLHYKFVGDLRRRVREAITRGEHFGQSLAYRRLDNSLNETTWRGSFLSPHSRRYEGPATLLHHGLMSSSPDWGA